MPSSSDTSTEALAEVKKLMASSIGPKASLAAKRKFQEHLITLPSYPEYENKAFFGTLVAKLFGEFEDLQDSAIDALLDLCEDEDEKVRIIGIKGLGPTGRADPRWVRGNAGVLLQLLACQPRELKYVKESLHLLLSVSPKEVFSMMIDDCKTSEEETGASKKNILLYLQNDAAEHRRDLFQMGNNLEAEDIFRQGLFDILETANEEETKIILTLLEPMSTVSGKNASEESKKKYLKALIKSVPTGAPIDQVLPLITSFKNYVARFASIDSRIAIFFLAKHGNVVVKEGMSRSGFTSRWVVDKLKEWIKDVVDRWAIEQDDRELGDSLAPAFVKTVLPAFLDEIKIILRKGDLPNMGNALEPIFFTIYRLATIHDRRSQVIHRSDTDILIDLAREASRVEKRWPKGSTDARKWANVVDMAEILADNRAKIINITPSWDNYSRRTPSGPSSYQSHPASIRNNNDSPRRVATPPAAPRGPRTSQPVPSGPRNDALGQNSSTLGNAPTGPSNNGIRSSTPSGPSNAYSRPQNISYDKRPRSPERRPRSPDRRPRSPDRRPLSPVRSQQDSSGRSASGRPLKSPTQDKFAQSSTTSVIKSEIPPIVSAVTDKSENNINSISTKDPSRLKQEDTASSSSIRPAQAISSAQPVSYRSNRPEAPSTKDKIDLSPRPTSLVDRLGASTSSTTSVNKRPREDDESKPVDSKKRVDQVKDVEKPSLLSRLGSRDGDAPIVKRVKEDIPKLVERPKDDIKEDGGKLSLFDRINGKSSAPITTSTQNNAYKATNSSSSVPSTSSPATQAPSQSTVSASISSNRGLSILNRSATSSPQPPSQAPIPVSDPPKGLSFLSRSSNSRTQIPTSAPSAPKGFSILNRSSSSSSPNTDIRLSPPTVIEEGVVRKGRGFRARTPDGVDIVMSDNTPPITSSSNGYEENSSLAGRLSNGFNGGIRGRGRGGGNLNFGRNGRS